MKSVREELADALRASWGVSINKDPLCNKELRDAQRVLRRHDAEPDETMALRNDLAELRASIASATIAKCHNCGNVAACLGQYSDHCERDDAVFSCDECCGHGNEDGMCFLLPDRKGTT